MICVAIRVVPYVLKVSYVYEISIEF